MKWNESWRSTLIGALPDVSVVECKEETRRQLEKVKNELEMEEGEEDSGEKRRRKRKMKRKELKNFV